MTTAGRPTFDPAKGGSGKNERSYNILSKQFSNRDLPGQLHVKTRVFGQDSKDEQKDRDYKKELIEREKEAKLKKKVEETKLYHKITTYDDEDDPIDQGGVDESDEETDDEEETAALLAELQRIRKERADAKAKKETAERDQAEKIRVNQNLTGNPLLNPEQSTFLVKRRFAALFILRWNDDVIFKNCAKDNKDRNAKSGFINDMLRSEFHKRFMEKYIK
ncbi:hypothetical protein HZS_6918 [Henneguya salminicola]|nr:hypothetical protein HZS_6918 [Henneguya salminicola]